jgi:hypothetical protein
MPPTGANMEAGPARKINAAFLVLGLLWLLRLHAHLVAYPHPLEVQEGCMEVSTRLILQGRNPWALDLQPQANNCYGAGFPLLAAALGRLFGAPTLVGLRAISAAFVLGSCLLFYGALRRLRAGPLESGWLALMLYACLLYYSSPLARPDAQGLFFFLAAILLPLAFDPRPYAWACCGALACLACLTKLYFGLAFVLPFLWLAAQGRWGDLARLSLGFAALAAGALWAILRWGDIYLYTTLFNYFSDLVNNHPDYVRFQLWTYAARQFLPSLALGLALTWAASRQAGLSRARVWILFSCATLLLFILKLGGNYGSYLVYLYQWNLPFALLALATLFEALPQGLRPLLPWALALQWLVLAHGLAVEQPQEDLQTLASWETVETEAVRSHRLFAPWDLASWQVEHGREVQDAGQRSDFLHAAEISRRWPGLFPRGAEIEAQVAKVEAREDRELRDGDYDLVMLHKTDLRRRALVEKKYRLLGWVPLAYPQGKGFEVILAYRLKS